MNAMGLYLVFRRTTMVKVIINERVQEAMDAIMNGGYECAEWCFSGHKKEHLGTFEGNYWIIDAEEEIKFLQMFIEEYTKKLSSDGWWDYKQDCAVNIRAAATLLGEIISVLW